MGKQETNDEREAREMMLRLVPACDRQAASVADERSRIWADLSASVARIKELVSVCEEIIGECSDLLDGTAGRSVGLQQIVRTYAVCADTAVEAARLLASRYGIDRAKIVIVK